VLWDVVWAAWGEAKHSAHRQEERVAEYVDDLASPTLLLLPFKKVVIYTYETLHQHETEY